MERDTCKTLLPPPRTSRRRPAGIMPSLGVAMLFLALPAIGVAAEATMFRGDARHTGVYDAGGVPKLTGVKWTFKTGGHVIASPAVHGDTLYVGSTGGILYALD